MSSATLDPTRKTFLDTITDSISHIQRKQLLTKQRFYLFSHYFLQSIGLSILLYFILQIPFLLYILCKLIFQLIFQILTISFWPLLKIFQFVLPKTTNYGILFPIFSFLSILSFFTVKFSLKKHAKFSIFLILLLLQTVFILRPIAFSIQEQRKLSLSTLTDQMKLAEMSLLEKSLESDVNDKHSNLILKENKHKMLVEETLLSKVSSDQEPELLFKQQINSKILDQSYQQQIKESHLINNCLNVVWNIWHNNKFFYSLWKPHMKHIPQRHVSSIYTNFDCTEHTNSIDHQSLSKQKHLYILDTYRSRSPFPIYLSILKSNGPQCYHHDYSHPLCIKSSKFFNYSSQFWILISIQLIIFIMIIRYCQRYNKTKSTRNQAILSNQTNDLSVEETSVHINTKNSLFDKIVKELYQWLDDERIIGYRNMSETYRRTLNDRCLLKYDHPQIESLQFSNITISNISQTCNSPNVNITGILTIHSSVFTLLNPIRHEQYLVEIRKLVGDLEISLINEIQLKFLAKQIGSAEIIDSKNVSSSDGKQSILRLLTELINKTTVQFAFQQEKSTNQLPETSQITTASQSLKVSEPNESPLATSIIDNKQQIIPPKERPKNLLIRIVKAVKLHDVERPFCILELNHPKQVHKTSVAKNGLNPFWDEQFIFECNDKSNEIRLKIIDKKKPNKKPNTDFIETLYADVSIPFSYVTSTIYKKDVPITPQYPESIIRIEFSTLTDEEAAIEVYRLEQNRHQSPSTDVSPTDPSFGNNFYNNTSSLSQTTTTDIFPTPPDNNSPLTKPRKSPSFMNSLRNFASFRRKKNIGKSKINENGVISSTNCASQTNTLPHSFSAEPFLYSNATGGPTSFQRQQTITRSIRNIFRSSSRKKPLQTDNFIIDHPDLLATSPDSQKKLSFFHRFRSKRKTRRLNSLANSLTSYDRTRTESVHNTPIRANGSRPVTMTK